MKNHLFLRVSYLKAKVWKEIFSDGSLITTIEENIKPAQIKFGIPKENLNQKD